MMMLSVLLCDIQLTSAEEIKACVNEAEARIEIAVHYNNPYPRMVHHDVIDTSINMYMEILNVICTGSVMLSDEYGSSGSPFSRS